MINLPGTKITKKDGQTGVVRPSAIGVCAVLACSSFGPTSTPNSCTDFNAGETTFGPGPLVQSAALLMSETGNPTILIRSPGSIAATYTALTTVGAPSTGASAITAGASAPLDDYDNVTITFLTSGTVGTAGITYTYNLSNGDPAGTSAILSLGTGNMMAIPNVGISLALGAGNVLAGETVTFSTTRPSSNAADVAAMLEALRTCTLPYEALMIDIDADATIVPLVETWIVALNAKGKFPIAFLNVRRKGAAETEAAYQTALSAITTAAGSAIDVVLCADGGYATSLLDGNTQFRPAALGAACQTMGIPRGVEPAEVDLGPIGDFNILDPRGGPLCHNEEMFPGLDALGLTTFRTFSGPQGTNGTYITNGRMFSGPSSDYVYIPNARTMNRACEIAYATLQTQLSRGVAKNPKAGPQGQRYIAEHEAQRIEALVMTAIGKELTGQVDQFSFQLSRVDDISSNQGATVNCYLQLVSLAYIKQFAVTASFVKAIASS